MKYSCIALAALAAVATASNSTTTSNSTVLIPSNITDSCTTLLTSLNADSTISSCVTPLINATASFSPSSSSNLTEDTINYSLASICKSASGCDDSTIRSWLTQFYSECYTELTSSTGYNSEVRELYDILYVVNPLKSAVCSVDSGTQEYCVNEILAAESNSTTTTTASNSTSTASTNSTALFASFASTSQVLTPVQLAAANLYIEVSSSAALMKKRFLDSILSKRDDSAQTTESTEGIITPNATTYKSTNLPFLFLQPSMSSSALCTPCTREVMVSYIKWETQVPYALGLAKSPILGGQSALWSAINSTCGTTYVAAIKSEAGSSLSTSSSSSGAESVLGGVKMGAVVGSMIVGAVALLI